MNADTVMYLFLCGFLYRNENSNLTQHCLLLNQEDHTLSHTEQLWFSKHSHMLLK